MTCKQMRFNISKDIEESVDDREFALPMGYMPMPIHSNNKTKDPVLQPYSVCSNFYKKIDDQVNDSEVQEIKNKFKDTFETVRRIYNIKKSVDDFTFFDMATIYDYKESNYY